jgi:tol-pal system protein YbgF
VEQHDLKVMNDQQKSFYQDLDQRIAQLKNPGNATASSSTTTTTPSAASSSAANDGAQLKDSSAYQAAFNLLESKDYAKAEKSFLAYVNDFPNGQYVANAHYWLGEIYFSQKNNEKAIVEFNTVIDKFSQSPKVSDAKLKIAIIHQQTGNTAQARTEFLQIKQQHPGSTAAQLANIRLQEINSTTK